MEPGGSKQGYTRGSCIRHGKLMYGFIRKSTNIYGQLHRTLWRYRRIPEFLRQGYPYAQTHLHITQPSLEYPYEHQLWVLQRKFWRITHSQDLKDLWKYHMFSAELTTPPIAEALQIAIPEIEQTKTTGKYMNWYTIFIIKRNWWIDVWSTVHRKEVDVY